MKDTDYKTLISEEDRSVNFVFGEAPNHLEARFVRRTDEYIVCYVSVKRGCNKGCTFCHLTPTKQTNDTDATLEEILMQVQAVRDYYTEAVMQGTEKPAKTVHFNFMARGDALDSKTLLDNSTEVLSKMSEIFDELTPKFNISTIFPKQYAKRELEKDFKLITPTIYYSLYSVSEEFRKKWMPNALPINEALAKLKSYQESTKKIAKIHFALIKGENDSMEDALALAGKLKETGLIAEFNIVRYNPYSEAEGEEATELKMNRYMVALKQELKYTKIKLIEKVGFDVHASCGMFAQ